MTHKATRQHSEKPKPTCQHCQKPGHHRNQCRQLRQKKDQARNNTSSADNSNDNIGNGQTNSDSDRRVANNTNANNTYSQKKTEGLDLSAHSMRPVVKPTTPQKNVTLERTQRTNHLPGTDDRKDKTKSNREILKATQMRMFKLQHKLLTRNATSSLRSCICKTGDNRNTKTSTNSRGCLAATLGDVHI